MRTVASPADTAIVDILCTTLLRFMDLLLCVWGPRKLCPTPLMSFSVTTVTCLANLAPSSAYFNFSRLIDLALSKPRADIEAEDFYVLFLSEIWGFSF